MEDKVKKFLESGLLEFYVYGGLDQSDIQIVEKYIRDFPVVKKEYDILQNQLEKTSLQSKKTAPGDVLPNVIQKIRASQNIDQKSVKRDYWKLATWVVSSLALLMAYFLFQSITKYNKLESEFAASIVLCEEKNKEMRKKDEVIDFLKNPNTKTYPLKGNNRAPDLDFAFYVNKNERFLWMNPIQIPQIPTGKCLQLWGDKDGEMIPIAVLTNTAFERLIEIDPDFVSLNVTMEDKKSNGSGQDHPDVSNLIANTII